MLHPQLSEIYIEHAVHREVVRVQGRPGAPRGFNSKYLFSIT